MGLRPEAELTGPALPDPLRRTRAGASSGPMAVAVAMAAPGVG